MSSLAEVKLWERTIGAVFLEDGDSVATFDYDSEFRHSGIEVSPLHMPLSAKQFRFPALLHETFHGLPGLLADALPDRFGNALIDAWLARQGREAASFNAVERLCYTGTRGMGALEFFPTQGPRERKSHPIEIEHLVALASDILQQRGHVHAELANNDDPTPLRDILQVGTSAGGARAKAVIAWNPDTQEVRSGQVRTDPGFEHWLLKFDGVSGNRDKEMEDPTGYGLIEYAYSLMAKDAGLEMEPCRLLQENGRSHFMTQRFDRTEDGSKLHMQSLGSLAHFDFNQAGAHGYEQCMQIMRQLEMPSSSIEQQFRRMVFNILARNQDDHVKNIAFLMNKQGAWSLSPAFDVTYSYQPSGAWTCAHQMTLQGKRDDFSMEDFRACGRTVGLVRGRAERMVREVQEVVASWPLYAERVGLKQDICERIDENLRRQLA
ncbi:MAG: type II toxin-antitoxin system HipA family toxin [Planctomycetota bacterium]|nr:type II toxin-antitoxin system HipA family toxin [Planctomycetota bacterium]MDA1112785.1 type II toxin-antitoxin system HipA family toxin [Planctomycetota bacterium]